MKIKYEDIDRVINILQQSKDKLKPGEVFEFNNNKLEVKNNIPTKWCIKATNKKELDKITKFICKTREAKQVSYYYHYPHLPLNITGSSESCWAYQSPELEVITIEQFKEFIKNKT